MELSPNYGWTASCLSFSVNSWACLYASRGPNQSSWADFLSIRFSVVLLSPTLYQLVNFTHSSPRAGALPHFMCETIMKAFKCWWWLFGSFFIPPLPLTISILTNLRRHRRMWAHFIPHLSLTCQPSTELSEADKRHHIGRRGFSTFKGAFVELF